MGKLSSGGKSKPGKAIPGYCNIDQRFQRFTDFKVNKNRFATLAYGHAGKPKVLHYSVRAMVHRGAILTALCARGTIFSMDVAVLLSLLTYLVVGITAGTASYLYNLQTNEVLAIAQKDKKGKGIDESGRLDVISNYLNLFIPFILGLYLSVAMARWWMLRSDGVGKVLDACQNVSLLTASLLPDADFHDYHDQIVRYALASVSLVVRTCRGNEDMNGLGPAGEHLLTDEEIKVFQEIPIRPRPQILWAWILAVSTKVCEEQGVAPGKQRDIVLQCVQARNGISLIWSVLGTQLPFAYVHLVTFIVNMNNLLVAVKCGIVFVQALDEKSWLQAASQVIFLCVVPLLYQGMLSVSYVIHDPFGEDLLDFPVMAFQEYCNAQAVSVTMFCNQCPALRKSFGPEATHQELALRKGLGRLHAERIAALQSQAEASKVIDSRENGDEELKMQLAAAVSEQAAANDKVMSTLKDQHERVQSQLGQLSMRLRNLENATVPVPVAPTVAGSGWCSVMEIPLRSLSRPRTD